VNFLATGCLNIIRIYIDHMNFAAYMAVFVYYIPSCSFGSFSLSLYIWFVLSTFVFVSYVILLLCLCILIVMYSYCYVCYVFYILFSSCQLAFLSYPD